MPKAPHEVLAGRYELSDQLGAGGMAEVHLGRDRVLGRTIAVKTLLRQFATDPSFIARFRREAQSAASLNHPQIVGVYDTGTDDGTYYIVMEYIDGKTLRDVIKEEGPLLPERAAEIAADVCAALSFAHQHSIVHRDVKPANIMLTKSGGVKVTDFGIARAMTGDTVTQTAAVLGTAQYFSPEQAQAAPVDARSDIYSLGVVLYEMLTRQVPFTGPSPVAIAYKHVKEDAVPPSRLNPDVPQSLESIVMKALAKNPANRYQSAQDMRADLQRAIQGRPVEATPVLYAPIEQTGFVPAASDETVILTGRTLVKTPPAQKRRTGVLLLVALALAMVSVLVWALTGLGGKKAVQVDVPQLIGLKQDVAQATLRAKNLQGDITLAPNNKYAANVVSDQDPPAGQKLTENGIVHITVSTGPASVSVPDLKGLTQDQASAALKKVGLVLGTENTATSDSVAKGLVLRQDPGSGKKLVAGQSVDVTYSSGKDTAIVPDVVGRSVDDAKFAIESRRLKFKRVDAPESPDCPYPANRVCKQSPEQGKTVEVGTEVTVTVSTGAGVDTGSPSPSPTPTATPSYFLPALIPFRRRSRSR